MNEDLQNDFGKLSKTNRGFALFEFKDQYSNECSLQESSLATEYCIWLGLKNERMHLTQDMVKNLLPFLFHFAETGEIANEEDFI